MVRATLALAAGALLPIAGLAVGTYICFFPHAESVVGTDFLDYALRHGHAALARDMIALWVSFGVLVWAIAVAKSVVAASYVWVGCQAR